MCTRDAYTRAFQYKILNNVLYLNQKLFLFRISQTNQCSFCMNEETIDHIFSECTLSREFWDQVRLFFGPILTIPLLLSQSALFGFYENVNEHNLLIPFILLSIESNLLDKLLNELIKNVILLLN